MKDFYGNELTPGDRVIFATKSMFGEGIYLREHKSGTVTVRPVKGKDGRKLTRKKYYHAVEGRFIDPYLHIKEKAHYIHIDTGEKLTHSQLFQYNYSPPGSRTSFSWREENPDFVSHDKRKYIPDEYEDYVRELELDGGYTVLVRNGSLIKTTS